MSEEALREVIAALPGEGSHIRYTLGWSHEQTYAALVRLYDAGRVVIRRNALGSHEHGPRIWTRP